MTNDTYTSEKAKKKRLVKKELKNLGTGLLFLAPNLIGYIIFVIVPVLASLFLCFTKWDVTRGFKNLKMVGIQNFERLFHDTRFIDSFWNNIKFTICTVPVAIIIALLLAMVLNNKVYCMKSLRAAFFLPYITNVSAACAVWMMIFQPTYGPINGLLRAIGVANPPSWLSSSDWSLFTIGLMHIWRFVGYNMVIYLAAIQNISEDVKEAARIDGVNNWQLFTRIIVPLLSPTTFMLLIIGIINSFKVFGPVNILTQGGPGNSSSVLVYYIYESAFSNGQMGYAAAMSWVLFLVIFTITLIQWRGQKKWVDFQ